MLLLGAKWTSGCARLREIHRATRFLMAGECPAPAAKGKVLELTEVSF